MHHSEVIKLVEKFLDDPDSVSYYEFQKVTKGANACFGFSASSAEVSAAFAASAAGRASAELNFAKFERWRVKARKHVAKYHELTNKDKD